MKDLTWIKTRYIAHRGLHTLDKSVPENSISAFEKAIAKNYGIEMDVNILKDGNVVVFHDKDLQRMCGIEKNLGDVTYEDIKGLKLLNTKERIPLLKDVLEIIDGRVPLLIELKPHGDKKKLFLAFLETIKDYQGVYAIHSFSPKIVYWFKKYRPDIIRGQITEFFRDNPDMNRVAKYLMKSMSFNRFTKPDFINYGIKDLPNKYCDRLHKKKMAIIAYASQNQKEFAFAKKYYDNSVFEYFIPE